MKSLTGHLYFWVLLAIVTGGTIGYVSPETGVALKPLGDGFIALVKMLIGPIIFCTVVLGIAGAGDMKKVGRVGGKALLYFEVVSTFALVIGLVVANLIRPGAGFNADPATLDSRAVADYAKVAASQSTVEFLLHVIPRTFFDAFTGSGDLLQVLFVAVLFGYAMTHMGKEGNLVHQVIATSSHVFFRIMNVIMKLAPLGAGGAMAFTIGRYGVDALKPMAWLMGSFYLTCLLFVLGVLGGIAALTGFSILRFIALHQGRAAHRARHLVIGVRARAADAEARTAGVLEVGGRPGRARRLLVQPGRHQHLPDDGLAVRGAGAEHRSDDEAAADDSRRGHADVEGSLGRDRRRVHHAGCHPGGGADDSGRRPGAHPGHRPLHVRSALAHQLRW